MKNKVLCTAFLLLLISGIALIAFAGIGSESYRINTSVFSGGGDTMNSENFRFASTIGQPSPLTPPREPLASDSYILRPGFWHTIDIDGSDIKTVEMNLPSGWSLISLPVHPEIALASILFPGAEVIYGYDKDVGYIRVTGNLETGKGYWILLNEAKSFTLTGQPIYSYTLLINKEGWLIIGGCISNAEVSSENCNIKVIYKYIQGRGYERVDSKILEHCNGYWILIKDIGINACITVQ
ncbi:MAG: hypothetical protein ACMUIU_15195 [bacterium]